jgi:hypothetical protein
MRARARGAAHLDGIERPPPPDPWKPGLIPETSRRWGERLAAGWVGAGFGLALLLTAAGLAGQGLSRSGVDLGLKLTARLAFVPFWLCYTAGSLVILFGPAFAPLRQRARELGLTFAAVLAVHLGLVAARSAIGAPPGVQTFLIFGPGAACAAVLALASIGRVGRAIGPAGWWGLRNVAMNYLLFDFAVDFVRRQAPHSLSGAIAYLPFAGLVLVAPVLRIAAWAKLRMR